MPGTAGETPPEPSQPWVERVIDAAKRAEAAAAEAEAQTRKTVMTEIDPGAGAEVGYPDRTVIHVYE